jgi:thiol-disulfide isomerase/thioredoxin
MINLKNRFGKALEMAANFSIIVVAILATTVLVKSYLLRSPERSREVKQTTLQQTSSGVADGSRAIPSRGPAQGTLISLPGVSWQESKQTVVLALSDKCHFCSESAPFYQRLAQDLSNRSDVRLIAIFPQDVDAGKQYLAQLGVSVGQIIQAPLDSLQVRGTPTLVIVDKNGTVMQSWVGKLNSERESEVLNRIKI